MSLRAISRRGLLTSGVAAAVLSATGMPARAGRRGGTLRLGLSGARDTDGWDARGHGGAFMRVLGHGAVFDCLTEITANGELAGELAQSWEASRGAQVWVFDLRRDVVFHDGTPFCAEDVIASLALHQTGTSPVRAIVRNILEMERLGRHQVRFTLAGGNVDFPFLMADPHLVIYPHGDMAGAMARGIGTGLYRVETFEAGVRARLARVPGHYKDGRAGWFDAVDAWAMDDTARAQALGAGRVDVIDGVTALIGGGPVLAAAPNSVVLTTSGNARLSFDLPKGSFDARLWLAARQGVDRAALVQGLLGGRGSIAADHPLGPANAYLATDLGPPEYDPDFACHLLRKTDFEGLRIALPDHGEALTIGATEADRKPILNLTARFHAGRMTEDWAFTLTVGNDFMGQRALALARSELDSARRADLYRDLQCLSQGNSRTVVPVYADTLDAHSRRLAHPETTGTLWGLDSHRIAERWWFA